MRGSDPTKRTFSKSGSGHRCIVRNRDVPSLTCLTNEERRTTTKLVSVTTLYSLDAFFTDPAPAGQSPQQSRTCLFNHNDHLTQCRQGSLNTSRDFSSIQSTDRKNNRLFRRFMWLVPNWYYGYQSDRSRLFPCTLVAFSGVVLQQRCWWFCKVQRPMVALIYFWWP